MNLPSITAPIVSRIYAAQPTACTLRSINYYSLVCAKANILHKVTTLCNILALAVATPMRVQNFIAQTDLKYLYEVQVGIFSEPKDTAR